MWSSTALYLCLKINMRIVLAQVWTSIFAFAMISSLSPCFAPSTMSLSFLWESLRWLGRMCISWCIYDWNLVCTCLCIWSSEISVGLVFNCSLPYLWDWAISPGSSCDFDRIFHQTSSGTSFRLLTSMDWASLIPLSQYLPFVLKLSSFSQVASFFS